MMETLALVLVGVLLLNLFIYFQQPRMVFFPSRPLDATPADWGLAFEEVRFQTQDAVSLHGWYVPRAGASRVLLFLHGNAGNISHRRESVEIFHSLGLAVFIFDYRGYGKSGGAPSEAGLYRDASAAWQYLTATRGFAPEDILIFGRSLGGAVAAHLASQVPAGGVILESTFSSVRDFARRELPLLSALVALRYHFDSVSAMAHVRAPVLVLHSRDDEIIPFELALRLYEAVSAPKRFVELRGDHNSGFLASRPGYDRALRQWLLSVRAGRHPDKGISCAGPGC
jgi:hypothetical protein